MCVEKQRALPNYHYQKRASKRQGFAVGAPEKLMAKNGLVLANGESVRKQYLKCCETSRASGQLGCMPLFDGWRERRRHVTVTRGC